MGGHQSESLNDHHQTATMADSRGNGRSYTLSGTVAVVVIGSENSKSAQTIDAPKKSYMLL